MERDGQIFGFSLEKKTTVCEEERVDGLQLVQTAAASAAAEGGKLCEWRDSRLSNWLSDAAESKMSEEGKGGEEGWDGEKES